MCVWGGDHTIAEDKIVFAPSIVYHPLQPWNVAISCAIMTMTAAIQNYNANILFNFCSAQVLLQVSILPKRPYFVQLTTMLKRCLGSIQLPTIYYSFKDR